METKLITLQVVKIAFHLLVEKKTIASVEGHIVEVALLGYIEAHYLLDFDYLKNHKVD